MTHTEYMRGYRRKHRAEIAEYQRDWWKRNPTKRRTKSHRYQQKYRDKYLALKAVMNALRRGKLFRPDHCGNCGLICKPEAHHPDYLKRLEVKWLCKWCHTGAHPR